MTSATESKQAPRKRRQARVEMPPVKPAATAPPAPKSRNPASQSPATPAAPDKPVRTKPARSRADHGMSALDAAFKVLSGLNAKEAAEGVTTGELVMRMENAGLWKSPGGKTPAATLYSAMTREIATKQSEARFRRIGPGRFAAATAKARKSRRNSGKAAKDGGVV